MAVLRVLVCDGFRPHAVALKRMLEYDNDIAVAATCIRADDAVAAVPRVAPDLVMISVGPQGIGALSAVEEIMSTSPMPVLVLLSRAQDTAEHAAASLAAGALDAVWKEDLRLLDPAGAAGQAFRQRARLLARAHVIRHPRARLREGPRARGRRQRAAVIGICASTGGPTVVAHLLAALPADYPIPLLVVQHIATGFTDGLVRWLDSAVAIPVRLATDRSVAGPGATVAPEAAHLRLAADGRLTLDRNESAGLFRPSGDALLSSIAATAGRSGVAIVLTGMGQDGAAGAVAVRDAGGIAIAQNEESSAVFGMPKAAIEKGVRSVLTPGEIATFLLGLEHEPLARAT